MPDSLNNYTGFQELFLYFWSIKTKNKGAKEAAKKVAKSIHNGKVKEIKLRGMRKNLFDQMEQINF